MSRLEFSLIHISAVYFYTLLKAYFLGDSWLILQE